MSGVAPRPVEPHRPIDADVIDLDDTGGDAPATATAARTPTAPARPEPLPANVADLAATGSIDEQRGTMVGELRNDPAWGQVPDSAKATIERAVLQAGTPALLGEMKKLIAQPGFSTRLTDLGRLSLIDLARRNPAHAENLNKHYPELSKLLDGEGYERLAPEDQDRVLRVLAEKPFIGAPLTPLLNDPSFRGLDQRSKSGILDRIDAVPANQATAAIALERVNLGSRSTAARQKANQIVDMLKTLERGESPWWALLSPSIPLGHMAIDGRIKEKMAELLSGPDANDVYRHLEAHGEGRVHDVMKQLIEKPDNEKTRGRIVRILKQLDPDNSAKFISNLSHGIGKELEKEKVFDAIAKGTSISGNVAGVGISASGANGVTVTAPPFAVGGVPVSDLSISFDPNPLREVLANKKDKDYRNLLTEVLDSFTKEHELMSSPGRWSDRQKREYFDAIKRLPGGQGASDLSSVVGRPNFRNPTNLTPGGTPPTPPQPPVAPPSGGPP